MIKKLYTTAQYKNLKKQSRVRNIRK